MKKINKKRNQRCGCKALLDYFTLKNVKLSKKQKTIRFWEVSVLGIWGIIIWWLLSTLYGRARDILPTNIGWNPYILALVSGVLLVTAVMYLFVIRTVLFPKEKYIEAYMLLWGIILIYYYTSGWWPKIIATIVAIPLAGPHIVANWKSIGYEWVAILLLASLTLVLGIELLNAVYGVQTTLPINGTPEKCLSLENNKSYELRCNSYLQKPIAGHSIKCGPIPEIQNLTGKVDLYNKTGETTTTDINKGFITSEEIVSIYVYATGFIDNKRACFTFSSPVTFISAEEFKKNKESFTIYLIGLINITMFIIPKTVIEIAEHIRKKRGGSKTK